MNKRYCKEKQSIPEGAHFVILNFRSISIPGDERSRTNPGHGYPASTEHIVDYIAFTNREDWESEIVARMKSELKDFVALEVKRAVIETSISVKIS